MVKISPNIKLPLNICKGSVNERQELAKSLNRKFFYGISLKFRTCNLDRFEFEEKLAEITKNKIRFFITNSTDSQSDAALALGFNKINKNETDHFILCLPLKNGTDTIFSGDANIFMHETFHLFFEIANPKHIKRFAKIFQNKDFNLCEDFYDEFLYSKKFNDSKLKNEILPNFLQKLPDDLKIDFLQNSRYRLKEELLAHEEGFKYHKRMKNEHPNFPIDMNKINTTEEYHFPEKLEILDSALKEVLINTRNNLKKIFMLKS